MSEHLNLLTMAFEGVGEYRIPQIKPVDELYVKDWIGFNYVPTTKKCRKTTGVHFYIDDYQFERVWNQPWRYSKLFTEFGAIMAPNFSTYLDFPKAVRIFNQYRSYWCGAYWQQMGAIVIPSVEWGLPEDYDWCFDGAPEGGIVAVSNVGCMRDEEYRRNFMEGYKEMLIRLQPKEVLMFGHIFDDYPGPVHYIKYQQAKGEQGEE